MADGQSATDEVVEMFLFNHIDPYTLRYAAKIMFARFFSFMEYSTKSINITFTSSPENILFPVQVT